MKNVTLVSRAVQPEKLVEVRCERYLGGNAASYVTE